MVTPGCHQELGEPTLPGYRPDQDNGAWLGADLAALHGSPAQRPWARALWALAHGHSLTTIRGSAPTKC
jgi:hypothetical protein